MNGVVVQDLSGNSKNITDAMLVHNVYELQAVNNNLAGDYMLANDIDASDTANWNTGKGFIPIGRDGGFNGSLDGAGCAIEGLYINIDIDDWEYNNAGLFDFLNTNAFVHNLTMHNGSVTGRVNVGSIAGRNDGKIKNVYNMGTEITGNDGNAYIGGIVGSNGGVITDAHNTGKVHDKDNGYAYIGGIVGENTSSGIINYSDNDGAIIGYNDVIGVGGISGFNGGNISDTYNSGIVTASSENSQYVGGIVGENEGDILNSYNKGKVEDSGDWTTTGGIAGYNIGTIDSVYNTGEVIGSGYYVGGIAGQSDDNIIKMLITQVI